MPSAGTAAVQTGHEAVFVPVSVAGRPTVQVCIDPTAGDAVAGWFTDHDWIDEPVQRAFLDCVRPGHRVLDLGSHLGLFSLSASVLGASVLAVDANPEHTRLLSSAADRNDFGDLNVANVALAESTDGSGVVRFVPRSIHGHVLAAGESDDGTIEIATATVDQLLDDLGWDGLDVIKMDIEGSEIAALRGMAGMFGRGGRPAVIIESNASMLALQGSSVPALRGILGDLGYQMVLIDHLRPGVLVRTTVDAIQTESASDLLAVIDLPEAFDVGWRIEDPLSKVDVITRILDAAASPADGYRRHSAELLRDGPAWLHDAGAVGPALAALDVDVSEVVRADRGSGARSVGQEYRDTPEPGVHRADDRLIVWADGVSVVRPPSDLERHPQLSAPEGDLVLRDVSFHIGRGEPIGIVSTDRDPADLLLAALDGEDVVSGGDLSVRGHVVSLRCIGAGLEPSLSVQDNIALFGAFLGCHVPAVEARQVDLLGVIGLAGRGEESLHAVGAAAAQRLALAVAFECTQPDLLLVGELPAIEDIPFAAWLRGRAAHLRNCGTSVVQVVHDPSGLFIEPTRILRFEGDRLVLAGHAGSVIEMLRLRRLGFRPAGSGWRSDGGRW